MPTNSAQTYSVLSSLISVHTSLSAIITNKRRVSALKSLGIVTVEDALTYYPFRVTNPLKVKRLQDIRIGEGIAFYAQIQSLHVVPMNARRGFRLEINVVQDQQSSAQLIYFSKNRQYVQWIASKLYVDATIVVGGVSSTFNGRLQFTHPQILIVNSVEESDSSHQSEGTVCSIDKGLEILSAPQPIYHANSRIATERIHDTITDILTLLQTQESTQCSAQECNHTLIRESAQIPNILPQFVREKHHLMERAAAIYALHNPQSTEEFHKALETLRYEEAFVSQMAVLQSRENGNNNQAKVCNNSQLRQQFVESLPFTLTQGQQAVIDEIVNDLRSTHPMRRLLQGEVGSGKTVVALAAMLEAVGSGHQAILVAPTQVLASQHVENLRHMMHRAQLDVPVIVVTGGMKLAERRRALAEVASGKPALIVATHAAFSSTFQPTNLAMVVIDEQHRFGVVQRDVLMRKMSTDVNSDGRAEHKKQFVPHLLVMTATPIPRSAAMTWFGDLDASYLTELPGGRKPIRTFVVQENDSNTMSRMFAHIRSRIDAGERAYIVCAHIEDDDCDGNDDSENFDDIARFSQSDEAHAVPLRKLHTVVGILKRLSALPQFQGVTFAQLTGRDDDATKRETMERFVCGDVQVLVATTVIEVGVDVPQASCIVIFDADRFGLAQLHQLRGRVGRGGTNSWAFLIAQIEEGSIAQERLRVLEQSLDGAQIAQKDLELRNVGDVLGDSQSGGRSSLKLLRVVQDAKIIAEARNDALETMQRNPQLTSLPHLAGAVLDFTRGGNAEIISN